ncbi:MAG: DUF1648 domain-containing protein [Chloroflexi bacterium]|nr:DUF1648 domain-containing protein [Chloroflexota bacterium]
MAEWNIKTRKGLIVGIVLMVLVVTLGGALVWFAITRPLNFGTFLLGLAVLLCLGLVGLMAYWLYGLARSNYALDRNALVIHWGINEQTIPTQQVQRVVLGEEITGHIRFRGGLWPGHCVGYGELPEIGTTLFYGTARPRQQVFIVTPGLTYGISPADRDAFIESLNKRIEMGPTQTVEQSSKRPRMLEWPIWQDRLALGLLVSSALLLLGLVGLLSYRFPGLPDLVPLHFDALGLPDRIGSRAYVFIIPTIGLLALMLNGALGWILQRVDRIASYLLWGGAILVQTLGWAAAIGILRQVQ